MEAALAWYRARGVRHEPVGPTKVPTLYIWGDADDTVGRAAAEGTGGSSRPRIGSRSCRGRTLCRRTGSRPGQRADTGAPRPLPDSRKPAWAGLLCNRRGSRLTTAAFQDSCNSSPAGPLANGYSGRGGMGDPETQAQSGERNTDQGLHRMSPSPCRTRCPASMVLCSPAHGDRTRDYALSGGTRHKRRSEERLDQGCRDVSRGRVWPDPENGDQGQLRARLLRDRHGFCTPRSTNTCTKCPSAAATSSSLRNTPIS